MPRLLRNSLCLACWYLHIYLLAYLSMKFHCKFAWQNELFMLSATVGTGAVAAATCIHVGSHLPSAVHGARWRPQMEEGRKERGKCKAILQSRWSRGFLRGDGSNASCHMPSLFPATPFSDPYSIDNSSPRHQRKGGGGSAFDSPQQPEFDGHFWSLATIPNIMGWI